MRCGVLLQVTRFSTLTCIGRKERLLPPRVWRKGRYHRIRQTAGGTALKSSPQDRPGQSRPTSLHVYKLTFIYGCLPFMLFPYRDPIRLNVSTNSSTCLECDLVAIYPPGAISPPRKACPSPPEDFSATAFAAIAKSAKPDRNARSSIPKRPTT